ncbi:MAG TPA: hypothetical protein VN176_05295 [Verrucomicrobiae bacterium]|jgi:hypothetical protein|nr:hypothetical protein [Verrucomicrobiae bacterium]
MNAKQSNWHLWIGFALSIMALAGYVLVFQTTRDIFWVSLALCIVAALLLVSGLRRAFGQTQSHRGKIAGPILTICSALVIGLFGFGSYVVSHAFAVAHNAPNVGQKVPQFTLVDSAGKTVSLAQLLAEPVADASGAARPTRGVLLVFYRGYW